METIITYLDNMFATLPKTKQIETLKKDLLSNMEDKYNELKNSGKSENEAIGIVISEFGNIDELINEFDIVIEDEKEELPELTEDDVNNYLEASKKSYKIIGLGVFLCLLGVSILILITTISTNDNYTTTLNVKNNVNIGLIPFFLLVATAVGLFIYAGMIIDKYKHMEYNFKLPIYIKKSFERQSESFHTKYTFSIIIGVILCILSPMPIFVTAIINETKSTYGVIFLLLMIAIAVYLFIYYGGVHTSYKKILQIDEYSKTYKENKKDSEKVVSAVSAIIWPLAVAIFLISGLIFNKWHIAWIVFPITGILFAMFSNAYPLLKKKNN